MRTAPAGDESGTGLAQMGYAALAPVAHGTALLDVEVAGVSGLGKAVAYGQTELLGPAGEALSADADGGMVGDESCRLPGGYEFCHLASLHMY